MFISSLRRVGSSGVSRALYMTTHTLDVPLFQLRRKDKYEFIANWDRKTIDKKMKDFRRQFFVYSNLKQDPHVFLQYRYNENGKLEFYESPARAPRISLSNPAEITKIYQQLAEQHGLDYSVLQKLGLPFYRPDFSKAPSLQNVQDSFFEENLSEEEEQIRAEKIIGIMNEFEREYVYEPDQTAPQYTLDKLRIDCAVIVNRPPIFFSADEATFEYLRYRYQFMKRFLHNKYPYIRRVRSLIADDQDFLRDVKRINKLNLDNYPTHQIVHKEQDQGLTLEERAARAAESQISYEVESYCSASKHFTNVNPNLKDPKHLHYAPQNRVYFIVKDKASQEWIFPYQPLGHLESFAVSKLKIIEQLGGKEWLASFPANTPEVATQRPFLEEQEKDIFNLGLEGVRTFYFLGYHARGLPRLSEEQSRYDDYVWVPKYEINKYLSRDYFETVKEVLYDK